MANTGVFTDIYRQKYAQLGGGLVADPTKMPLVYLAVGEGGYQFVGASKVPKTPLASQTQLEATIKSTDVAGTSTTGALFVKALPGASVVVSGATLTITCILATNEPNLDLHSHLNGNLAGAPELFELGVFDGDPLGGDPWTAKGELMVYATLDEIVKVAGSGISITVTITE